MKLHYIVLSLLFLCIFVSCEKQNGEVHYLNRASEVMGSNPDSAFLLLDSIKHPERLDKRNYMNYVVQRVRAKYKLYQSIEQDSLILEAKEYFEKNGGSGEEKALMLYYTACYYKEIGDRKEALVHCIRALEHAKDMKDPKSFGKINSQLGNLYYNENLEDSAIVRYKEALKHFISPEDDQWIMHIMRLTAVSYTVTDRIDSGLVYNRRGLEIARENNDSFYIATFLNNIGFINLQIENYQHAKELFLESLHAKPESKGLVIGLYISLSNVYKNLNQIDSAYYYGYLALDELNNDEYGNLVYLSVSDCLSKLEEEQGNYEKAFAYQKLWIEYNEKELVREKQKEFVEIERKYRMSQKENQLMEMRMRETYFTAILIVVILMLVIAVISVLFARSLNKRMKQQNEMQARELIVKQREIEVKQRELDMKDLEMKNMMFVIDIYKRITNQMKDFEKEVDDLTYSYSVKKSKLKGENREIAKGYDKIQDSFKRMKDETQENLHELAVEFLTSQDDVSKEKIAELTTPDLLLLSLAHCRYEHKDIANILSITSHALQMRKQRLRNKLKNIGFSDSAIGKFSI